MADSNEIDLREDPRFVGLQAHMEEAFVWLTERLQEDGLDQDTAIRQAANRLEHLLENEIDSPRGPAFDSDGYLPPIQTCTEAELIRWFGFSDRRGDLLIRVRNWVSLAKAVGAKRLLLDGSFVTKKDQPGDVDAVVLLPVNFHKQLEARRPEAVELLVTFFTREPKELFFAEVEEDWWGWFEFFSRTRELSERRKGLIEVQLR